MVPHIGCPLILTLVCTVFIMGTIAMFDQQRQPLGPEMCKRHCGQFSECTVCIFLIRKLACIATKYPPQTNGEEAVFLNFTKERIGSVSQNKGLCKERPSRILLTRSSGFRCLKLRTEGKTRLLVVPRERTRKKPLSALSLLNSSTTTYPHIQPEYVTAMAYVPSVQQVLMALYLSRKIQAYSLHTTVSVTVKKKIYAVSIAVDDDQQLVFLATRSPKNCVFRMTPDGRDFKNITCQIDAFVLCLDTRRAIVYVGGIRDIHSFKYDGQDMRLITKSQLVHGLTLGENGDVIYYNDKSNVMEFDLFKNGTGRKLTRSYFQISRILYNNGMVYISYRNSDYIYVYHVSNFSCAQGNIRTGVSKQLIALMQD